MMGQNPAVAGGKLAFPANGALEIKMAGRARHGRNRGGHILVRFAGDRARRIEDGGDRDRSFLFSGGRSRRKRRRVHQHATALAMAREGGRSSGRLAVRRVVHASTRVAVDRESESNRTIRSTNHCAHSIGGIRRTKTGEPKTEAVLAEINGWYTDPQTDADGVVFGRRSRRQSASRSAGRRLSATESRRFDRVWLLDLLRRSRSR